MSQRIILIQFIHKPHYEMKTVSNMTDLLSLRGCGEESFGRLKRNIYKYTACGAWVTEDEQGVTLGSIVEGVDEGTETHSLTYPFTIDQFQDALQSVEDEADEIWKATHGCEDCNMVSDFHEGLHAVNPECKTCKGEGMIF